MQEYWGSDFGAKYNPDRQEAFSILDIKSNLDDVIKEIKDETGKTPVLVSTDARKYENTIGYQELRDKIHNEDNPYLMLLGTGWGLTEEMMKSVDYILEPIYGPGKYNHLSVRSAASIILDRLLGETWWE
ncbi:SAM-dependent RNA methyltransferase [Selenihalanaerobacter shriftii]|uniref:SAM-dependent RNA methyltransferase n=2 Tax=Selenihalanaerobacter shriftii TaxID=142842 RepID=A0A1T4M9Y6_9FIRM|nr:SAM-dependent RNA methyltransferase [Selenihalanaerobacter shriftii]